MTDKAPEPGEYADRSPGWSLGNSQGPTYGQPTMKPINGWHGIHSNYQGSNSMGKEYNIVILNSNVVFYMLLFAAVSIIVWLFAIAFLPETSGFVLEDVDLHLSQRFKKPKKSASHAYSLTDVTDESDMDNMGTPSKHKARRFPNLGAAFEIVYYLLLSTLIVSTNSVLT